MIYADIDNGKIIVTADAEDAERTVMLHGTSRTAKLPPLTWHMPLNLESIRQLRDAEATSSRSFFQAGKRLIAVHRFVEAQKKAELVEPIRDLPVKPGVRLYNHQVKMVNIALALMGYTESGIHGITGAVSSAVDGGKSGIVSAWEGVKSSVSTTWNQVLDVIKTPINSAQSWLVEKVNYFKGLFNFKWQLPEFKLPKVNVSWDDVGWGIKIPKMSVSWNALGGIFNTPTIFGTRAGLQGVGEAGPEAILPLDTLWDELSVRLKTGMREIMTDMRRQESVKEDQLLRAMSALMGIARTDTPSLNVTQNIYANETSYVGQQREATRNLRQIARAMG